MMHLSNEPFYSVHFRSRSDETSLLLSSLLRFVRRSHRMIRVRENQKCFRRGMLPARLVASLTAHALESWPMYPGRPAC